MGDKPGKITYNTVGKHKEFIEEIIKAIPPQFKPTSKTGWIAMSLLLFFILFGVGEALVPIFNISFDITRGEALELSIQVGYPMVFFGTGDNATKIDISIWAAIVDIILYTLIGYIIDILINFFMLSLPKESKSQKSKRKPKVFSFKKTKTDGTSTTTVRPPVTRAQPQYTN